MSCRTEGYRENRLAEYVCIYCGLAGDTVDHIPPTSVRQTLIDLGLASRYPFTEVRACKECNCAIGARPLWTIASRREYVKKWIERRYRKYLNIPDWSDLELARISPELAEFNRHGMAVRDLTKARLRYYK